MKVAMIAEAEEVELEALALHHLDIRDVLDADLGKVRLAGDGAEAGELRAVEAHPVIMFGVLVLKGFQNFRSVVLTVFGLAAAEMGKGIESTVGHAPS